MAIAPGTPGYLKKTSTLLSVQFSRQPAGGAVHKFFSRLKIIL